MAARPIISLLSLLFLAGGLLLQFLVILSGGVNHNPINQIYFLQASTSGIPNARDPSRWTFFAICGVENGRNANCGAVVPALPFDPRRNFGTETGVPERFANGSMGTYLISRFMFAFYLIALFFGACAFVVSGLAFCTRVGAYLSALNAAMAWFFQTLAAALMTAWTVRGRNGFKNAGLDAKLGVKAYGFTWGAMACYFLAMVMFCIGGTAGRDRSHGYGNGAVRSKRRFGLFGRRKSTRSRGSMHKEYE